MALRIGGGQPPPQAPPMEEALPPEMMEQEQAQPELPMFTADKQAVAEATALIQQALQLLMEVVSQDEEEPMEEEMPMDEELPMEPMGGQE